MKLEPQWVAIILSAGAFLFAIRRDTRNAKNEDIVSLRRERDECLVRVSAIEAQMRLMREDNLLLMSKVLGLEGMKH